MSHSNSDELMTALHRISKDIEKVLDPSCERIEIENGVLILSARTSRAHTNHPTSKQYHSIEIYHPHFPREILEKTPSERFSEGAAFLSLYRLWRRKNTIGLPESEVGRDAFTQGYLDSIGVSPQAFLDILCPGLPDFDRKFSTAGQRPKHINHGSNRETKALGVTMPSELNWIYGILTRNRLSIDSFTISQGKDIIVRRDTVTNEKSIEIKMTDRLPEMLVQRLKNAPLTDFIEHPALNSIDAHIRSISQWSGRTTITAPYKNTIPLAHQAIINTEPALRTAFTRLLPALNQARQLDKQRWNTQQDNEGQPS